MARVSKSKKRAKKDYTQEAYQGIRRLFFLNEIVPGQKISYRDLSERLKMSPTPVIQALKRLEFQGLVRHEPNRGYYTEPISIEEIIEIYDFRELIELSLLPKTIEKMTSRKLDRLKTVLQKHLDAVRDISIKERLIRDMDFHLMLAELSGCKVQVNTLKSLFDLLYLKYRGNILFVTPMDRVDSEHQKLYDAIAESDIEKAKTILSNHIQHVKKHAILSIEKMYQESKELI